MRYLTEPAFDGDKGRTIYVVTPPKKYILTQFVFRHRAIAIASFCRRSSPLFKRKQLTIQLKLVNWSRRILLWASSAYLYPYITKKKRASEGKRERGRARVSERSSSNKSGRVAELESEMLFLAGKAAHLADYAMYYIFLPSHISSSSSPVLVFSSLSSESFRCHTSITIRIYFFYYSARYIYPPVHLASKVSEREDGDRVESVLDRSLSSSRSCIGCCTALYTS